MPPIRFDRPINKLETAPYSAHVDRFFDSQLIQRYMPDYVDRDEYRRLVAAVPSRYALVKTAEVSRQAPPYRTSQEVRTPGRTGDRARRSI